MTQTESLDILSPYKTWIKWLVLALSIFIYANTINHEMALDDYSVIDTHSHVQKGIEGIGDILSTNYRNGNNGFNDGLYRPLSLVMFALEKEFFDSNTSIAHLINLLIYAFACFFLFLSLSSIFSNKSLIIPLSITLLFISHPLHTEVVANIKGRDELLAFFGLTLSLYFFSRNTISQSIPTLIAGTLFFIVALFSKESSVTYAIIIPLLLLLKKEVTFKKSLSILALLLPFSILFMLLRAHIIDSMPSAIDPGNFGLLNNPIAASADASLKWGSTFALQLTFLQKLLFPLTLIHDYSYNQIPLVQLVSLEAIVGIICLLSLSVIAIWGTLKRKWWGITTAIYLITIVVSSQVFIPIGIQFAERMLFLSVLPLAMFLILFLASQLSKASLALKEQKKLMAVSLLLFALFSIKTIDRNGAWKNNLSLYQADIVNGANSARSNYNLGSELNSRALTTTSAQLKSQYLQQAIVYLNKAIEIYPDYYDAYNNLGLAYKNNKAPKEAINIFKKAIQKNPSYTKNYFNLATVYLENQQFRNAILSMQEYVNRVPNSADAYYLMGKAAGSINQFEEAISYLNQSISIAPNNIAAYNFLGMAYGMTKNNQAATNSFTKALQLNPNNVEVLMNLALSYRNQGEQEKEKQTLKKVLNIAPNNQTARNQLNSL